MLWGFVLIPAAVKRRREQREPALAHGKRRHAPISLRRLAMITTAKCLIYGAPIVVAVYVIEEKIVDTIVYFSTAEQRQTAFAVLLFTSQYQKGLAILDDFPLTPEEMNSASGKTFMAVLPAMAGSMAKIRTVLEPTLNVFARQKVVEKLGSPSAFYNKAYSRALADLYQKDLEYNKGVRRLQDANVQAERKAASAWQNYVRRVGRSPSPRACIRIRPTVRQKGNPVPDNWDCRDRGVFMESALKKSRQDSDRAFHDQTRQQLGEPMPSNLDTFDKFLAYPAIQKKWRKEIGLRSDLRLRMGYTPESFNREIYESIIAQQVDLQVRRVQADIGLFEPGRPYYADGRRAYRALVVAPIALFFSLIGAFGHFIKSAVTLSYIAKPDAPAKLRRVIAISGLIATASLVMVPNVLTTTDLYRRLIDEVQAPKGDWLSTVSSWAWGGAIAWVSHTQPLIYPLNDAVRTQTRKLGEPYDSGVVHLIAVLSGGHDEATADEEPDVRPAPLQAQMAGASRGPLPPEPSAAVQQIADAAVPEDTAVSSPADNSLLGRARQLVKGQTDDVRKKAIDVFNETLRPGTCEQRRAGMLAPLPQALIYSRYARDIYRQGHDAEMLAGQLTTLDLGNNVVAYRDTAGARYAEVHTDAARSEVVVVFRGTRVAVASDVLTDVAHQFGVDTGYYRWAADLAAKAQAEHPGMKVVTTGQSLGGGLAIHAVVQQPGITAVAFNPAGLPLAEWATTDTATRKRVNAAVVVYSTRNSKQIEPITALSFAGRSVLPGHIFLAPIELLNERALHGPDAVVSALEALSTRGAAGDACDDNLGVLAGR